MTAQEVPVSTKNTNLGRGWRPIAIFAALALSACSAGKNSSDSTTAQRELFPSKAGAPAPMEPSLDQLLIDCGRHPNAHHTLINVADEENLERVGDTLILGTYDEAAPVTPGGKPTVKAGIKVEYKGGHRYLVEPVSGFESSSPAIKVISSNDPTAVASYSFGGANFTVETTPIPMYGAPHKLGIAATIACNGAARP